MCMCNIIMYARTGPVTAVLFVYVPSYYCATPTVSPKHASSSAHETFIVCLVFNFFLVVLIDDIRCRRSRARDAYLRTVIPYHNNIYAHTRATARLAS